MTLRVNAGHDIEYPLRTAGSAAGYYLQDGKEPPGQWAGKGAGALGLTGQVDPGVYRNLFGKLITPTGEKLYTGRPPRYVTGSGTSDGAEDVAVAVAGLGPFTTPAEVRRTRAKVLGSTGAAVPFYDLTFSATKSVSLLQASYAAAAAKARATGDLDQAAEYERRVRAIDEAVAALFPQHDNRNGEPNLHVHIVLLNRAMRADHETSGDRRWRSLYGRPLWKEQLGLAAEGERIFARLLAVQGIPMIQQETGNAFEVGGVQQATMDAFSVRTGRQIDPELRAEAAEYERQYGRPPSARTLWEWRQHIARSTRKAKQPDPPTGPERLAAWEQHSKDVNVQILCDLHEAVSIYAATLAPPAVLTPAQRARTVRIAVHEVRSSRTGARPPAPSTDRGRTARAAQASRVQGAACRSAERHRTAAAGRVPSRTRPRTTRATSRAPTCPAPARAGTRGSTRTCARCQRADRREHPAGTPGRPAGSR